MSPEVLYRVYFQGTKYSQPTWEIVKLEDGEPVVTYLVTNRSCNCPGFNHRRYRRSQSAGCRHFLLRDYYEANSRPVCFLRVSGSINIFKVGLPNENGHDVC